MDIVRKITNQHIHAYKMLARVADAAGAGSHGVPILAAVGRRSSQHSDARSARQPGYTRDTCSLTIQDREPRAAGPSRSVAAIACSHASIWGQSRARGQLPITPVAAWLGRAGASTWRRAELSGRRVGPCSARTAVLRGSASDCPQCARKEKRRDVSEARLQPDRAEAPV